MQLARLAGAEVVGTASARKHEHVRSLGAEPLDYREEDVRAGVRGISPGGVDAVFDHVGGLGLADSYRMLRKGGTPASRSGSVPWRPQARSSGVAGRGYRAS